MTWWRSQFTLARAEPLIFIGAGLLFLWPLALHPNDLPIRPGSPSDLLLSHLPNALYIRQSLVTYGQLPLWNTQIMAGQPFAGDPLSGLWYPPDILLWALPLPAAFNLLFVLHLAWGGYGLFKFLAGQSVSWAPALFSGLAFTGTPKLIAHLGAGHASLVFAVVWTPWLLSAVRRAGAVGRIKHWALAGAILALIFLADVRWAFYAGALAGAYGVACWRSNPPPLRGALSAVVVSAISFGLFSAVLAVPLAEFVHYSDRSALSLADAAAYSLPPYPYLIGLVYPIDGVIHEWVVYFGILPFILAVIGAIASRRWFWIAAAAAAALFSLGTYGPLFPAIFEWLPAAGFLRVPPRAWFIVVLSGCVLAGDGLQAVMHWSERADHYPLLAGLKRNVRRLVFLSIVITMLDLLRTNLSAFSAMPLPERPPATVWLAAQPGLFRVYSPSASLPWPDSLQHAEGVDPLHLKVYAAYMAAASGIGQPGYSVSVPAFFVEDPDREPDRLAQASRLDPAALGRLNVRFVAVDFPLGTAGLTLRQQFGQTHIYENDLALPRASIESGAAQISLWSPDRIVIQAAGPGRLQVRELAYPGWAAWVDGVSTEIGTADGLLRTIQLSAGTHRIVMEYHPLTVYAGGAAALLGLALLAGLWWRS